MFSVRSAGLVARVCLTIVAFTSITSRELHAQVSSPWTARDIGSPTPSGTSQNDGASNAFTITAGGADIWGTSDKFHFVYQAVTGDVDVIARVDSITRADSWSKSGVMIRASITASSAHAFALVSAGNGVAFQRRTQSGGTSTHTTGNTLRAPQWVRLVRAGTLVTAYTSSTGSTWTKIGSDTIALGSTAYVGIATTSHNSTQSTIVDVSNVSVGLSVAPASQTMPSTQKDADIGSPAVKGSASYNKGSYTINAAGTDIWGTSDQFHYVYQQVTGDVDISARVSSISNVSSWAKAGVMIRQSLSADSKHALSLTSVGNGYAFQRRPLTAGLTYNTSGGTGGPPGWVRLKRAGSLFTAYRSSDGRSWTVIGSDSIPMSSTVYAGIAVTSHNASLPTRAIADTLSITQSPTTNAPPSVTLTAPANGSTFASLATITISASASDPEGQLSKVEFYANSTRLATDTTAPYTFSWPSVAAGTYSLTAMAYDAAGAASTSAAVSIKVGSTTATLPRYVVFNASPDHYTLVTSYRFNVYANGANPSTATPIKTVSLGKPAPDSTGQIKVDEATFFQSLATGTYVSTVSAIGSGGSTQSGPVTFTR